MSTHSALSNLPSMMIYFWQTFGAKFSNSLESTHWSTMMSFGYFESWCACRNAPDRSTTATYRPSFASMVYVIKTRYSATIGDASSSFLMAAHCGLPFMHALPLIYPLVFSFSNISDCSASLFFSLAISYENMCLNVS